MTKEPKFDVRVSAKRRAAVRLTVASIMSLGLIALGLYLLPERHAWRLRPETLEAWDAWAFIGLILVGSGLFGLCKELVFGIRSLGHAGHWHFLLTDDQLIWDVPDHAHGKEQGFRAALSEIHEIEFRTIERYEETDIREYWVHFKDGDLLQLRAYSGVSLSWLVSEIHEAGVGYRETIVQR